MTSWKKTLRAVVATAIAFFLLDGLNRWLFSSLQFSPEVNWIYLPSGLRLMLVLVFVDSGALGIVLACMAGSLFQNGGVDSVTSLGAAVISGFAPWLARTICIDQFKLDANLQHLRMATLFRVSVVFALLSAVLHQLWFNWRHSSGNFVSATLVMAVGDLLGTLAMLYLLRLVAKLVPLPPPHHI